MRLNKLLFAYVVTWALLLFAVPNSLLFSKGALRIILFLLPFAVLPLLLSNILKKYDLKIWTRRIVCVTSAFLAIPYLIISENNEFKRLERESITAKGIVFRVYIDRRHRRSVQARFIHAGEVFRTYLERDQEKNFVEGDTVEVEYLEELPIVNRIKELNQ
ncbi:hypothetical protein [Roseivirga sp. UBA1976]|uniref:hypothetical protein n=1 Tax=Roseivirga sp. UBA1976 TaxID=1947386 RepID=UPI00257A8C96|nr:hypothetical protein [Roseivirga sp. UBA1976]|tara:strand:- start:16109 stop:16591 length:483 start_codon:yes stop_codon:yes gene_type:complete